MNFFPTIWQVLHDGTIRAAEGSVPGDVCLTISIDYLRERFPDSGKFFRLTLHECTLFAYYNFGPPEFVGLSRIARFKPEILDAEMEGDINRIYCVGGILRLTAGSGSIGLDSGRVVELQEVLDAAEAYWTEWSARSTN